VTSRFPPTIVAIETSAQRCSVALAHAGVIRQQALELAYRNAEQALPMIEALLRSQGLDRHGVDAFAFASGPGAFTGLRVACALAQGLAYGCGRPVLAIGTLRALASLAGAAPGQRIMAATDARMGQVYWAVFEGGERTHKLAPAALADPGELADLVRLWRPDVIAGDALVAFEPAWPQSGASRLLPQALADAGAVARLACLDWAEGAGLDPRDAAPEYVRDQVALTVAQRQAAAPGSPR
jgi:tRNA threonylcarbamoyladenosine biosynthesis protein TsaB